jgi:hypothetical protein
MDEHFFDMNVQISNKLNITLNLLYYFYIFTFFLLDEMTYFLNLLILNSTGKVFDPAF